MLPHFISAPASAIKLVSNELAKITEKIKTKINQIFFGDEESSYNSASLGFSIVNVDRTLLENFQRISASRRTLFWEK